MNAPHGTSQAVYRAHVQFGDDQPDAMKWALSILNAWGRNEATLAHAVGAALVEAHKAGTAGEPLLPAHLVSRVIRRTPILEAPEEVVRTTIIRRTR